MNTFLVALTLVAGSHAQAALTPTAESLRRIQAITTSKDVYEALGNLQWISSIAQDEEEHYTVVSNQCSLTVQVRPVLTNPPQMVPPLKVTVLGPATCLP